MRTLSILVVGAALGAAAAILMSARSELNAGPAAASGEGTGITPATDGAAEAERDA